MKLTNKDKKYLLSVGYLNEDLPQIEVSTKGMRYEMYLKPDADVKTYEIKPAIRITQKQAIAILGRKAFFSGVARATFHRTASRSVDNIHNVCIYFEYMQWGK